MSGEDYCPKEELSELSQGLSVNIDVSQNVIFEEFSDSPNSESLLDLAEGFDVSHSPPLLTKIKEEEIKIPMDTVDEILLPPLSRFCLEAPLREDAFKRPLPTIPKLFSISDPEPGPSSSGDTVGVMSSCSQTPDFPYYRSFEWFKEQYPELLYNSPFDPPLIMGRAFSLSQLDQMDEETLKNYREMDPLCVPIPYGFWEEMGRVDSALNLHFKLLEGSFPNEDWVSRRLSEGSSPKEILERYVFYQKLIINKIIHLLIS